MTNNRFKYNGNFFASFKAMLEAYNDLGTGRMELVDDCGKVIAYIDPVKHLSGAKLSGVNLSGLDLSYADLRYADLSDADLRYADLRYANLRNADLSNADLSDADLSNADLSDANLSDADLSNASLRYANLSNADLRYADLRYADLSNAKLCSANMYGSNLLGATLGTLPSSLQNPRGKIIGYKKIVKADGTPLIAKVLIKGGTPRSKATSNKMRAKSVVVLGFYEMTGERSESTIGYSSYNPTFCYKVGKINCDKWDSNRWLECAGGIHFFLAWRDAVEYQLYG